MSARQQAAPSQSCPSGRSAQSDRRDVVCGGLTVRTDLRAGTADLNQEIIEQLKGLVQRLSSMTDAS
jgi:hypothetical protein